MLGAIKVWERSSCGTPVSELQAWAGLTQVPGSISQLSWDLAALSLVY